MLLAVVVHPANVQDRDGAEPLLRQARRLFPFIERIIGDAGYQVAREEHDFSARRAALRAAEVRVR
jgi:Transposase DDE domain